MGPAIRIRKRGTKKWYYVMKDGGSTLRLIRAVRYPSVESCIAELNHIAKNYPEYEAEMI